MSWRDCSGSGSGLPERATTFYTIGHSTRALEDFAGLLRLAGVERVVDVRTVPRSRTNPQYNRDVLPCSLDGYGIEYCHVAALGGLRPKSTTVDARVNGWWQNSSFHNYADYALSRDFERSLGQLIVAGRKRACAIMCAEAVWWRCHRRIVSDYLLAAGHQVFHLMGDSRIEPAQLTRGAAVDGRRITYPA